MSKNLCSLWMIGLGFGILFTLVAAGQYAFLRHQIDKETTQELQAALTKCARTSFRLSLGILKVIVILPPGQTHTS